MNLNTEQQAILDAVLKSTKPFIFIQGKAGTGKSFLVREIKNGLACNPKILVPTNMAREAYVGKRNQAKGRSIPAEDVRTIQSFFSEELDDWKENECQDPFNYTGLRSPWTKRNLYNEQCLILDEISMVRADLFEMMHKICQAAKGNTQPFGGIRIIAVGDLMQLPPVVQEGAEEEENAVRRYLEDVYGGIYFFNSKVIQQNLEQIEFYELKKSVRQQNDPQYEALLDVLREPKNPDELRAALAKINQRVMPAANIPGPDQVQRIVSTNREVEKINADQLNSLPGQVYISEAKFEIWKRNQPDESPIVFYGGNVPSEYNTCEYYPQVIPSQFVPALKYKKGSKVMFSTGFYKKYEYKIPNGEAGIIEDILPDALLVRPVDHPQVLVEVKKTTVERKLPIYDEKTNKLKRGPRTQKTTQYSLKSGYAFTIHKSQGQTYKQAVVDLGDKGLFAAGQLYVALSRVESLEGLFLTKPLTTSDSFAASKVVDFLNQMRRQAGAVTSAFGIMKTEPLLPVCQRFKDFILQSKLIQQVKDDICRRLQHYNSHIRAQAYDFAAFELKGILNKIDSVSNNLKVGAQIDAIRVSLPQTKSQADYDSVLDRLGNLWPLMGIDQSLELVELKYFEGGQQGETYEDLFTRRLRGATHITLKEPWLRKQFQFTHLEEFIDLLVQIKEPNEPMHLDIITREGDLDLAQDKLSSIMDRILKKYDNTGITFHCEYKNKKDFHDREISTAEWKIILGKGLHIWEPASESIPDQADRTSGGGFYIFYFLIHPSSPVATA